MEHSTTIRAESVDKAIKIGLTKLGITQDEAVINVISEGKKGLFGFGKQDAIVEISKNSIPSISELTNELETSSSVVANKVADEVIVDEVQREEVSQEVGGLEEVEIIEAPKEESTPKEVVEQVEVIDETEVSEDEENFVSPHAAEYENVARYLENVIREYGADASITVETRPHQVAFNIETEKSGLIIGKHGKIINSLQVLAQIMVHQFDKRRQSVILNIGDYRDRRASVLEQIAQRTAKEVLRTKRSVVLDPLPSYERKQIHAHLSKIDHIETHSEGRDPNRYLVVEYKA